ncbi:MAG: PQQ-binding-like beta-propeller repeat protein, partial [Candidatus Hydrogenedentota bacterium]
MKSYRLVLLLTISLFAVFPSLAQSAGGEHEWPSYAADAAFTRYAPLDQINAGNIKDVRLAWRWDAPDPEIAKANPNARVGFFKSTPLMVNGVLYVSTPTNTVAAIDAGTGKTIWNHDPKAYDRGNRVFQHRGVAYWKDGNDERIFIATGGRQLVAINAKTGEPVSGFGDAGFVDLDEGLDTPLNKKQISYSAPPMVVHDTIVLGHLLPDEANNPTVIAGHIRGFDARTGKQKWIFWTIPRPGEFGYETWDPETWKLAGAANNWTMMSADTELGHLYIPTGTPANDFYGGHRKGNGLFAESIICLDVQTGKRVWHFQGVHHGLWDYDFPAAPILVDINVDGGPIKALAQV